jgi:hypothetical protein
MSWHGAQTASPEFIAPWSPPVLTKAATKSTLTIIDAVLCIEIRLATATIRTSHFGVCVCACARNLVSLHSFADKCLPIHCEVGDSAPSPLAWSKQYFTALPQEAGLPPNPWLCASTSLCSVLHSFAANCSQQTLHIGISTVY